MRTAARFFRWQERLGVNIPPCPCSWPNYLFSYEGTSVVLEPGDTFKPIAIHQLSSGFMASAAIAGKAFYLRSKIDLYRIKKRIY